MISRKVKEQFSVECLRIARPFTFQAAPSCAGASGHPVAGLRAGPRGEDVVMNRSLADLGAHCRRPLSAFCLTLVMALPGLAIAAPSPEYGPEVEAAFRARCEDAGAEPKDCQALLEDLQARLGYEAVLLDAEPGAQGILRL